MKLILMTVALATALIQNITAADLDGIQNATPIGVALNSLSNEFGAVNNGDAAKEEHNLGGYRPLYPPYFMRNANQPSSVYSDKEYYSRGAHLGNFDSRLDRTLKTPAAPFVPSISPATDSDVEVYVVSLNPQSQPQSVIQLQNQPAQTEFQVPLQHHQLQPEFHVPHIETQSQQFSRHFSSFRTQSHESRSFFYNFKFPSAA